MINNRFSANRIKKLYKLREGIKSIEPVKENEMEHIPETLTPQHEVKSPNYRQKRIRRQQKNQDKVRTISAYKNVQIASNKVSKLKQHI